MNEKTQWMTYRMKWKFRKLSEKMTGRSCQYRKIGNQLIIGGDEANRRIAEAILSGIPFAAARYGMREIDWMVSEYQDRLYGTKSVLDQIDEFRTFDSIDEFNRYTSLVREDSKVIDYIAVWYRVKMEDWILSNYAAQAKPMHYSALEPYYFENPWSGALAGKKVLVINPFAELIEQQYALHRKELFENSRILPEFELKTMKSVWFIEKNQNQEYKDWFEALDYMKRQLSDYDFDVAILGCGVFGFHLAAEIKRMGRQAIVMGGATQILFGIKGKRWDEIPQVSRFYNGAWARPTERDKPKDAQRLDQGCYW